MFISSHPSWKATFLLNLARKERDAATMADELSRETAAMVREEVSSGQARQTNEYTPTVRMTIPPWCFEELAHECP
jgi:hypothetical protein